MNNSRSDIKNTILQSIIYRGESIFTLVFINDKKERIEMNLLNVQYLQHDDVLGGKVGDYNIQAPSFNHIKILEKRNLNISQYYSIWILVKKNNERKEIFGLIMNYETTFEVGKYNPTSYDKY